MHMKDDHMLNGQLKPAYNIQHAVNSGFIVAAGVFPNPTDVMTLKPFMEQMESSLRFKFDRIVADAGYESEENLVYLRDKEIEAYIKPSNYEQLGTKKFAREIGRKENMQYDKDGDYYICHNGRPVQKQERHRPDIFVRKPIMNANRAADAHTVGNVWRERTGRDRWKHVIRN